MRFARTAHTLHSKILSKSHQADTILPYVLLIRILRHRKLIVSKSTPTSSPSFKSTFFCSRSMELNAFLIDIFPICGRLLFVSIKLVSCFTPHYTHILYNVYCRISLHIMDLFPYFPGPVIVFWLIEWSRINQCQA